MKDKRDFTLESFLPYKLNITSEQVSKDIGKIYAKYQNLTRSQWRILAVLNQHGRLTSTQVCKLAMMEKVMVSRSVAELENKKLIKRSANKADKRSKFLKLTAKGNKLLDKLIPNIDKWENLIINKYGKQNMSKLLNLLDELNPVVSD